MHTPLSPLLKQLRLLALALTLGLFGAGCDLLGSNDDEPRTVGIYVANQGNFSDGNGSVTVYNPETQAADADAITDLGSIVQSVYVHGGRVYVVANTGGRIDLFSEDGSEKVGQIGDLVSPRYVAFGQGRAYVTNLYGNPETFSGGKVSVVDLASGTKVTEIEVGNNPEGVAIAGNRLFVANSGFGSGRTVSVIDTRTNEVAQTIDVDCDGPRFVLTDRDEDVWVFCTGKLMYDENWNVVGETDGAIRILDAGTGEITARIPVEGRLGASGPGQDAFFSAETQEMYVVRGERTVLRFDTRANALTGTIGPVEGAPIGAVAYDAAAGRLYVGHVPGFTTAGEVTIHGRDGDLLGRFGAGVAPTFIALREE